MELFKVNNVLGVASARLAEEMTYTVNGKKGVWRTVKGHRIFFANDGSDPIGMPGAMKGKRGGSKAKVTGGAGGGAAPKKKVPKKKTSSPEEIKKGKQQLKSKAGRKKAFGPKKKKLDDAAGGSGGAAVDDMGSDGSQEEKEALGKLDGGGSVSKKEQHTLLSGGVKKAMMLGLGMVLLGAFPAILGYAAAAMIMNHAIGAAGKRLARAFEDKTSRREQLAQAIEGGLKDAIAQLASGEVDPGELEKATKYAERKSRGKGSDASF